MIKAFLGLPLIILFASPVLAGEISGKVTDKDGHPIADATAFVNTASVKKGTSIYCPSCYLDCGKTAFSDSSGNWKLSELDSSLKFNVLIVAKGYRPVLLKSLDPDDSKQHEAALQKNPANPGSNQVVRGRIVDPAGKPVARALISVEAVTDDRSKGFGAIPGCDELAFTDEDGDFQILCESPIRAVDVQVEAPGFADKYFKDLKSGEAIRDLRMDEGVTVVGRLLQGDKPLTNVVVGLVQADRTAGGGFVGERTVTTDANGRYTFEHIGPSGKWFIYGAMGSLKTRGALPATPMMIDIDEGTHQVPDLQLCGAHRIQGRVVLADGQPVPSGTRLFLGREDAWDSLIIDLSPDGSFTAEGVPEEQVSIGLRVKGYRLSEKNVSLEPLNSKLVGQVQENIDGLTILLEPGEPIPFNKLTKEQKMRSSQLRNDSLQGAPAR